MKLSKHQKVIIEKIINGDVFDLQSYLQVFDKCHIEKYDMVALRKSFDESEKGKEYKVIKEGYSIFTPTTTQTTFGLPLTSNLPRLNIPENEYELKTASFIPAAPTKKYKYEDTEYELDFCTGVSIISNFDEVIDFLTLWSYLKQEALILEVNKPIDTADIGLFFESVSSQPLTAEPEINMEIDGKPIEWSNICDVLLEAPRRFAHQYSDKTWVINEEHLLMCKDFLGKKIIRTSALMTFSKKNFKTKEQVAQDSNYRIALIALIISVLSIIMSNIVPVFQKQPVDYLDNVTQQLSNIDSQLSEIKEILVDNNDIMETNVKGILTSIEIIASAFNDQAISADIEEILQELSEIK